MLRISSVGHVLGRFLLVLAGSLLLPLLIAWLGGKESPAPAGFAFLVCLIAGTLLIVIFRRPLDEVSLREGILLVVSVWVSVCLVGCLPFYFSPHFSSFTDAFFESTSGFTTTGASILPDVEVLPPGIQFWRCFTHWLGGLGIVMLGIAILPLVGLGGLNLYQAQFGGTKSEKLRPRFLETARALWKVYLGLSLAEYLALRWAGMNPFDAACHTFSTLGTGGFSTRTASIAAFHSPAVEYIIILFMVLASINFTQHYRLWVERRPSQFLSAEVKFHLTILLLATLVTVASLVWKSAYASSLAFRSALFQVTSILTCTGFATDDYEKWQPLPQLLLLVLMYVGGNTGSTAGGVKTFRILLLLRVLGRHFKQMLYPRGVFAIRVGHGVIAEGTIQSLLSLVQLMLLFNLGALLLVTASGVDLLTSISAIASTMFGVGPGLGQVGPTEHYGNLPQLAKWALCGSMLAGRLEFYTALVVFSPAFWRK